ncbi:MAG: alpha/beta hydrolase [Dehalococcoidia bacterium]|nr:alpha/beta hydrolase [Dehalococcoidia bacterium]
MTTTHHTVPDIHEPASRRFPVDGIELHYLEWGDPSNPPIVLLHGGGQNARTWGRVATRLGHEYRLLALDARGHGDSDWDPAGQYSGQRHREDVRELVTGLGLDDFVLVGMSMGGMTSLSYASTYGESLRGLVVVDIAPDVKQEGRDRILGFMLGRESFGSLDEAIEYAHAFNPRRSPEALRSTLPHNLRHLPDGRLRWKWDPACFNFDRQATAGRFGNEDLWEGTKRIPCPMLVVHGKESDILTADVGERLAQSVPNGRYVAVEGSGHSVQGDNPHSLSDAIQQLLREIDY